MADDARLKIGAKPGVTYPVEVIYCGNCTMPIEVRFSILHLFYYISNKFFVLTHSIVNIIQSMTDVSIGWKRTYLQNSKK